MIVTRQFESGRHSWASNDRLESFCETLSHSRMSNLESTGAQPDWREQYPSYGHQSNSLQSPRFEDVQHTLATPGIDKVDQRHTIAQLTQSQEESVHTIERPGSVPVEHLSVDLSDRIRHDSLVSSHSLAQSQSMPPSGGSSRGSSPLRHGGSPGQGHARGAYKEDNEEEMMMDFEGDENDNQTEAERNLSDKRKLKRFRLSHSQTRFLLSEFAQQAHPDAAHRDRLSREIPGLSARQVQVWFQNRRAKMKRLNENDRDRHIKMRQMPEHFDNVQALHSPYGAIHSAGTSMVAPIDYSSGYSDHAIMRPLLVDAIRREEDHMSSSGMSPAFQHLGFGSSASQSPVSMDPSGRYYGSQLSSPATEGSRSGNPFLRHNGAEEYHQEERPGPRPIQPLQVRETLSRNRSESLLSPLRASMSWKGDSLDYGTYQADVASPGISGRQQSMYQPDNNGSNYTSSVYSNTSQPSYPAVPPPSTTSPLSNSRYRASSSAYPPTLEMRQNQYRSISSAVNSTHPSGSPMYPPTPRHSFAPMTSTSGYSSAPLHAPSDFQLPRGATDSSHSHLRASHDPSDRDYQLSAPMAPPADFGYSNQQTHHGHAGQLISPTRSISSQSQLHVQDHHQQDTASYQGDLLEAGGPAESGHKKSF